jgi:hypothetical protein
MGSVTGVITFDDNSLNSSSFQQILLSGTATSQLLPATTTALTASPNPANAFVSVTLTATVKPTSGNGTLTGTVTFLNGLKSIGTGTFGSNGVATPDLTCLSDLSYQFDR